MNNFPLPVIGFAARSGTGKTTLIRSLIPLLREAGLRVAVIKLSHHDFEVDVPGKDSYELRKAGACQTLVASPYREALITEREPAAEPVLDDLVGRLDADAADLVLVEGFRHAAFPGIELHRASPGDDLLCVNDESIIAVAADAPLQTGAVPRLDLEASAVARFVLDWYRSSKEPSA